LIERWSSNIQVCPGSFTDKVTQECCCPLHTTKAFTGVLHICDVRIETGTCFFWDWQFHYDFASGGGSRRELCSNIIAPHQPGRTYPQRDHGRPSQGSNIYYNVVFLFRGSHQRISYYKTAFVISIHHLYGFTASYR